MADVETVRSVWGPSFRIDGAQGDGSIRLAQTGRVTFRLDSTIEYTGDLGLDRLGLSEDAERTLRHLGPSDLKSTDLASIPPPMRWWVNTYGVHTPAALIHDRFIGGALPPKVTEPHIDRYFRFMLRASGVRLIKRWVMWSAVALRTRFKSGGFGTASVILWALLALVGTGLLAGALVAGDWGWAFVWAVFAPIVTSLILWRSQAGAGIIAAFIVAPFLLVPMVISVVLLLPFWFLDVVGSKALDEAVAGSEPIW
jgi:uncharacterized protein DUF1353